MRRRECFAESYGNAHGALDVLVNNAGVLSPTRQTTVDGIELTFATNVLGYFLLTAELLEALKAGSPSRVVNVASSFAFGVDRDDLQFERRTYDGMAAYAQSKACDRIISWALARRLERASVTVNAMAPGLMLGTTLYRDPPAAIRQSLEQLESRSVSEGAETAVWLASSEDLVGVTGTFIESGAPVACEFRDERSEELLWQKCDALVTQVATQR